MANSTERGGSGNFANDPQKASEAGRKGGQQSHQGGSGSKKGHSGTSGQQEQADRSSGQQHGGSGSFADNPEKASDAGRKGGQRSHGSK